MGCGISKLGPEGSSGRDFCPLPRQCNVHPIDQEFYSQFVPGRKSVASPARDSGIVKERAVKQITTRPVRSEDALDQKERGLEKKAPRNEVSAKAVQEEESPRKEVVEVEGQNEGEEKEPCYERGDSVIGPASPSFREYCMDFDSWGSSKNGNVLARS